MPGEQYELNWGSREDRDVLECIAAYKALARKKAELEFARIANEGGERFFISAPSGWGGETQIQVHPESFHYWGQRLGYQCWSDPQFTHEYLRDNQYARVKNRARETTLLVNGTGGITAGVSKRFTKRWSG